MKDLKDTISLMLSDDYRERFKGEYWQTKIRYEKLKDFCNRIEAANMALNVAEQRHDCPFWLLRQQKKKMGKYLYTLEIRALHEGIDLED